VVENFMDEFRTRPTRQNARAIMDDGGRGGSCASDRLRKRRQFTSARSVKRHKESRCVRPWAAGARMISQLLTESTLLSFAAAVSP